MRVLISRKRSDYRFVAEVISRFKLNQKVAAKPEALGDEATTRIVERYQWGRVVFTHRASGTSSTCVVIYEKGRAVDMQDCLGFAADAGEKDSAECHGDSRAPKCAFLSCCQAIKAEAAKLGVNPDDLLLACTVEDILEGKTEGVKEELQLAAEVQGAKKTPKLAVRASTLDSEARLVSAALAMFDSVGKSVGKKPVPGDSGTARQALKDGQLYTRNRMEHSGYVGLYAYRNSEWDSPVCAMRPVPRTLQYHVKLPVTKEQLAKVDIEGKFTSYEKRADSGKSRFGVVMRKVEIDKLEDLTIVLYRILKRHLFAE